MNKRLRTIAKTMKLCKFFITKGIDFNSETREVTIVCMRVCRGIYKLVHTSTFEV